MKFQFDKKSVIISILMIIISIFLIFNIENSSFVNPIHIIIWTALLSFLINNNIKIEEKYLNKFRKIVVIISPIISYKILELLNGSSSLYFDIKTRILNIFWYYFLYLIIYLIVNNTKITILVSNLLVFILGVINYFVVTFRGKSILPSDIESITTALNVANNYQYKINHKFILATLIFICFSIVVGKLKFLKIERSKYLLKKIIITLSFAIISIILIKSNLLSWLGVKSVQWYGNQAHGFVLNFVVELKAAKVEKPEDYNLDDVKEIDEEIKSEDVYKNEDKPNIITIMNESFADLSEINEFKTNMEYMPFIKSLTKNTIKGYALSSVYGGNTPNSEYEFLTGNTLAFLPKDCIPYQTYIKNDTNSLVSTLKSNGYKTIAVHPYLSSGWDRINVYNKFGFDEYYFENDFEDPKYIRNYISDESSYDKLIDLYKNKDKDQKLFMFNITMQNHGGYTTSYENFTEDVSLQVPDKEYSDVNRYLSLVKKSDEAIEKLINYFSNQDEKTIIVFFGDHFPALNEEFYESLYGKSLDELNIDETQKMYKVPFFIWANYDIEEQQIDCTSINYLSSILLKTTNLSMTKYDKFLLELQNNVFAINSKGYLDSEGKFKEVPNSFDSIIDNELLNKYRLIQYNNMFDYDNKNEDMFYIK